eukprot:scaffold1803_cov261-Pinguiococcus_pyrenoidosus.AAC.6
MFPPQNQKKRNSSASVSLPSFLPSFLLSFFPSFLPTSAAAVSLRAGFPTLFLPPYLVAVDHRGPVVRAALRLEHRVGHPVGHASEALEADEVVPQEAVDERPAAVVLRPLLVHLLQLLVHVRREHLRHGGAAVRGGHEGLHGVHELHVGGVVVGQPVLEGVVVDGRDVPRGHMQVRAAAALHYGGLFAARGPSAADFHCNHGKYQHQHEAETQAAEAAVQRD